MYEVLIYWLISVFAYRCQVKYYGSALSHTSVTEKKGFYSVRYFTAAEVNNKRCHFTWPRFRRTCWYWLRSRQFILAVFFLRWWKITVSCLWLVTDVFQSKIRLGWNAGVFCASEILQLFLLVICIIRVVHKFFFGLIINETPNKWRPVQRSLQWLGLRYLRASICIMQTSVAKGKILHPLYTGQLHSLE